MTTTKILLTGATGNVGTQLVKQLALRNVPFRALVRSGDNAAFLKTIPRAEIIVADMADTVAVTQALAGIERVFLLTNSSAQAETLQLNFVTATKAAGVQHIVKLSQYAARIDSPVRFLRYHAAVEDHIREQELQFTFLRPNLYMQGLLAFADYIKQDSQFYAALGHAAISAVDIRDIAAVAAVALTTDGHSNKIYNITGPAAITHYEMAETLSQVLDKKVRFVDVSPQQMEAALQAAGFPEWQVGGLIEDYAHYARGEAAPVFSTVEDITGNPPVSFQQFANDYKNLFV